MARLYLKNGPDRTNRLNYGPIDGPEKTKLRTNRRTRYRLIYGPNNGPETDLFTDLCLWLQTARPMVILSVEFNSTLWIVFIQYTVFQNDFSRIVIYLNCYFYHCYFIIIIIILTQVNHAMNIREFKEWKKGKIMLFYYYCYYYYYYQSSIIINLLYQCRCKGMIVKSIIKE